MRVRSITLQLTLLFALSSTVILLTVGAVLGVLVNEHFVMLDVDEMEGRIRQVALDRASANAVINATPEFTIPAAVAQNRPQTADGLGTTNPTIWQHGDRTFRGIAYRAAIPSSQSGYVTIVAATDISHHTAFMAVLRRVLWLSVAIGIAFSVPLGWIAARRGTAPIREITRLAARVSADRLAERLPTQDVPSELAVLCSTFNDMLSRLEDSFRRLSEFSADLAHELRTPITNVTTQTQVVLSRARDAEEYRELLYSNLEEFQALARIVEDMLFLAKSDRALTLPQREPVDLGREADLLIEFFEALSSERGVRTVREGQALATGDRLMIRRALANILSNALRHSPTGATVKIALSETTDQACATVQNSGTDIAPEHLERIFDRFYRVDRSRGRADGGSGLGLAITKAIAESHGGSIDVRSAGGLTCFTLRLPKRRPRDYEDVTNASSSRQASLPTIT